jgi:hypothetical protein
MDIMKDRASTPAKITSDDLDANMDTGCTSSLLEAEFDTSEEEGDDDKEDVEVVILKMSSNSSHAESAREMESNPSVPSNEKNTSKKPTGSIPLSVSKGSTKKSIKKSKRGHAKRPGTFDNIHDVIGGGSNEWVRNTNRECVL